LKAANILVDSYKVFTTLDKKKKAVKKDKKKKAVKKEVKKKAVKKEVREDLTKTKVEDLKISARIISILSDAGFKTAAGITKKQKMNLKNIEGMGDKGIIEIKRAIGKLGLTLK